ncbi:Nn.00g095980.m01.CDS01 [Neocucurbitaria sp. VM-36]
MSTTTKSSSPFLDILPPELRITIYEHLLVARTPLKGRSARLNERYNLHTAILRVNRQIHDEACSIFFGRNTFYIASMPPPPRMLLNSIKQHGESVEEIEEEGSGAFEPPLQLKDLPRVRHLEIDLLYYGVCTKLNAEHEGSVRERAVCGGGGAGARRYIDSLTCVLRAVQQTLLSLRVCADVRRYTRSLSPPTSTSASSTLKSDELHRDKLPDEAYQPLDFKAILSGFHAADTSPLFTSALAALTFAKVPLHFDFPESYFDFEVPMSVLSRGSLVFLTGQVLFARSEIGLRAIMEELGDDDEEEMWRGEEGLVDLSGHVKLMWPSRVAEVDEGGKAC